MLQITQNFQELRRQLAFALMRVDAVLTRESDHPLVIERESARGKERGFRLKLHESHPEAPLSPIYLNLRTPDNPKPGPLSLEIVDMAAACMYGSVAQSNLAYSSVVGVPNAGDPFAQAFSQLVPEVQLLRMGKVTTTDGKRHIAALVSSVVPGTVSLLVDDLVTGADSKIEAIRILEAAGLIVRDVVVLVDREQGGRDELATHGYTLHSVFTITELLSLFVETGQISHTLAGDIQAYLAAN
ncbi:MAG: hypothetical protein WAT81_02575 [Candidatus Moraniibacteriota bacterium]